MLPRSFSTVSSFFRLPKRATSPLPRPLQSRSSTVRFQSRFPGSGYRQRTQYNRFSRFQAAQSLWQTSPTFRYGVGAVGTGAAGFVTFNIETVPVTGRKRFNWVSPEHEQQLGEAQYQQILQEFRGQILSEWDPRTKFVQKVLNRLIPHSGLEGEKWEVHVIDDKDQMNAFVIPGGKVFVFTGILNVCNGEDGLATVLGHEIAHNVAHHAAENYSRWSLILPIAWGLSFFFDVSGSISFTILDYAYSKPGSRKQETEADKIGLLMMAESCYNPEEAITLWKRMEEVEKIKIPQFMSTHPSSHNRVGKIQAWLPEAQAKRAEGGCGGTMRYAEDFNRAVSRGPREEGFW